MHLPIFPLEGIWQINFFTVPLYFNICSLFLRNPFINHDGWLYKMRLLVLQSCAEFYFYSSNSNCSKNCQAIILK